MSDLAIPKGNPMKAKKKRLSKPKAKTPEEQIQKEVEGFLRLMGLEYFHVPQGLQAYISTAPPAIRSLASGLWLGWPDLFIFRKSGEYNDCLQLELKTATGKQSRGQIDWARRHNVQVARSFEEAKEIIIQWEKKNDV